MKKFNIAVRSLTAWYEVGEFYADTLEDAIKQARAKVMPDMRGWHFYDV